MAIARIPTPQAFRRWPVRWRLTLVSASLTFVILLVFGAVVGNLVTMTGAGTSGAPSNNCQNWTVATGDAFLCGYPDGGPGRWTDIGASCHGSCGGLNRIVCMGKSKTAPVVNTPTSGRLIWLDGTVYFSPGAPGAVPVVPDAICNGEKPAGVTSAVALLAYNTGNLTRGPTAVLSPTMNYVRPDGTFVGTGATIAAAGALDSGIWQSAGGAYRTGGGPAGVALTGGAGGVGALTCTDWTSSTATGTIGDYGIVRGSVWWNGAGSNGCGFAPLWFYCVQTAP